MIAALAFLRAAWAWCRRNALAIVAGLAAIGGLVLYALGRRSAADRAPPTDATRAEGHAEILAEQAQEATRRADDARAAESALAAEQAALEREGDAVRARAGEMSAGELSDAMNALAARRAQRQRERGR